MKNYHYIELNLAKVFKQDKFKVITSEKELDEESQYLTYLSVHGDTVWTILYYRKGVLTEYSSGGDLQLTWEIAQNICGEIYKLPL